ncbi:MAG: single-stranded DNA-binding protein [Burkholderiales bacterium]|nr:single-stranded DNA-binding protein [Burkholderiales bacterium]
MAYVRVEQRNARLAAGVRIDTVQGKDGPLVKGTAVAISNVRKGNGEQREEEATSIMWTFWGKLAENAAEYLGKGARVNIVGRLQNNNYKNAEDELVYGLTFTVEEIDYLDSKADVDARRERAGAAPQAQAQEPAAAAAPEKGNGRKRVAGKPGKSAAPDDDVPF